MKLAPIASRPVAHHQFRPVKSLKPVTISGMLKTPACLVLAVLLALIVLLRSSSAADVTIDARTAFQRMDGFGTSERVFDDPHVFNNFNPATARSLTVLTTNQQDVVLDRLYIDLRLTRVRPANPETVAGVGIEPQNDNTDPNAIDPSKFDFAWKNLDAHIDYIARARQRGVNTWFFSPLNRETWMGATTTNDAAEYAEWLLAQALRCQALGVALPYLSLANEPSYSRNTLSGAFLRDVIKILGPKLRAADLRTLFVVPDDVRSSDAAAKTQIILADPAARSYVGALATHLYDEPLTNVTKMRLLGEQYGLPLWMTEFSLALAGAVGLGNGPFDYAGLIHELLATYNVSAVDYQWGFFGQWENKSQLVILNYSTSGAQSYTGFTLPKDYFVTGQYSKFIAPGARRIRADSTDSTIKVTAYVDWPQFTIVGFNNNTSGNPTVSFSLVGLPVISTVSSVRTSGTENWASLPTINVTGSTFTATLPHQSVTTFTAALPPLKLDIARTNGNVTLSWPVGAAGFALQVAGQLPATNWSTITNMASVAGDQRVITLSAAGGSQFYRLGK